MKTLSIFFLLITILVSVSTGRRHRNGGFTVDLIHRDSLPSPLRNPNHARFDRVQNAILRSMSRVPHFSKISGFNIDADIFGVPGEYIMKIQIGTPPVEVLGIADTGSDLTWAQCQPCKDCYKQAGPPFLKPSSSSTYQALTCQTKACQVLIQSESSSCDSKNYCHYKMSYGDQSYTIGDLAVDTFWFGQTSLKNVAFGCGHENKGTFSDNVSGIVGLGGGPLSIVNQLKTTIQGKFSYCLIPQFTDDTSNKTSKIHFGDDADLSGSGVVSTPIVKKDPSTYYYLTLENVVVGDNNLPHKKHINKKDVIEANIIIDSGTTLTLLPHEFYTDVSSSLTKAIGGQTVQDTSGAFEICYKDLDLERVPSITFRFDGADVVVPPVNMFLEVHKGVSCFTILPSDELAIFGNLLQQNLLVGFDLVNQKVSFKPTDCTMQ